MIQSDRIIPKPVRYGIYFSSIWVLNHSLLIFNVSPHSIFTPRVHPCYRKFENTCVYHDISLYIYISVIYSYIYIYKQCLIPPWQQTSWNRGLSVGSGAPMDVTGKFARRLARLVRDEAKPGDSSWKWWTCGFWKINIVQQGLVNVLLKSYCWDFERFPDSKMWLHT